MQRPVRPQSLRRIRARASAAVGAWQDAGTPPPRADVDRQLLRPAWVDPDLRSRLELAGERRLLLLHVPKTAGSSLRIMLAAHVSPERVFLSDGRHPWVDASTADLRNKLLFVGHSFLEPLYMFPDDDWVTVLPVREPLAWWRSWFVYSRRVRTERGITKGIYVEGTFGDWVDAMDDATLSNGQASWLLARTRIMFDNPLAGGRLSSLVPTARPSQAQIRHILNALLDRVTVLAPSEDVQGTYAAACEAMGWTPQHTEAPTVNASPREASLVTLTAAQESRLRRLNLLDQGMYERARQAGASRAVAMPPVAPPPVQAEVPVERSRETGPAPVGA